MASSVTNEELFVFAEKIAGISDFGKLMEEYLIHAERYKEIIKAIEKIAGATDSGEITDEELKLISSVYHDGMNARKFSKIIIAHMENRKDDMVPPRIDPSITDILTAKFRVLESREIPYAYCVLAKVRCLRRKALYYKHLAVHTESEEQNDEALEIAISTFKAAQDIANAELAPTHPLRLKLAAEFAEFYYEIVKSPDNACNIAKQALDEAEEELGGAHDEAKHELDRILYTNEMAFLRSKIAMCMQEEDNAVTTNGIKKKKMTIKKKHGDRVESRIAKIAGTAACYGIGAPALKLIYAAKHLN